MILRLDDQYARTRPILERWWMVPVIAFGLLILEHFRGRFGFFDDEGINLLKAFMVKSGFRLYSEVYSDQAPTFTWLQAALLGLFGADTEFFRQLAILFGLGALVGASAITVEMGGRFAGLLCAALLVSFAPFLKFAG